MLFQGLFAVAFGSAPRTDLRARAMKCLRSTVRKLVLQPLVLVLLGLEIAIALWGFGYRISLYQRHRIAPMRSATARLWIDTRSDILTEAQRPKNRSRRMAGTHASCVHLERLPSPSNASAALQPVLKGGVIPFASPVALRSPPSRLHLA